MENQIIGIDKSRETSGFHAYSIIPDSGTWLTAEKKRGLYYLPYINLVKEYDSLLIGKSVKAYKYVSGKWIEIDGWINWDRIIHGFTICFFCIINSRHHIIC